MDDVYGLYMYAEEEGLLLVEEEDLLLAQEEDTMTLEHTYHVSRACM